MAPPGPEPQSSGTYGPKLGKESYQWESVTGSNWSKTAEEVTEIHRSEDERLIRALVVSSS